MFFMDGNFGEILEGDDRARRWRVQLWRKEGDRGRVTETGSCFW